MTFVLDTSAATKLFIQEKSSLAVRSLVANAQIIVAPALLKIELSTVCIVQWRLRGLTKLQIGENIADLAAFLAPRNLILYANDDDFNEALALAIFHEHRIADCLFVALSKRLNMPLVTADIKQAAVAEKEAVVLKFIDQG